MSSEQPESRRAQDVTSMNKAGSSSFLKQLSKLKVCYYRKAIQAGVAQPLKLSVLGMACRVQAKDSPDSL